MKKYVIERNIPGIGKSSPGQLSDASQVSCRAIEGMNHKVQWLHSYVTGNKTYCIYLAPDKAAVEEHAAKSGFPANSVEEVVSMIDPTTAG